MKHVTRLLVANILLLFNMAVSAQDLNSNPAQANLAPDCSAAAPSQSILWPPNHKFSVIDILGISDPDGDLVSTTIQCIRQDEPLNSTGDGNTEIIGVRVTLSCWFFSINVTLTPCDTEQADEFNASG